MDPNLVPAISAVFMGLFAWLSRRDALRNEARTFHLESQNIQQADQIAKLEKLSEQCQAEHKQKDAKIEEERKRNHRLELSMARLQALLGLPPESPSPEPLKQEHQ